MTLCLEKETQDDKFYNANEETYNNRTNIFALEQIQESGFWKTLQSFIVVLLVKWRVHSFSKKKKKAGIHRSLNDKNWKNYFDFSSLIRDISIFSTKSLQCNSEAFLIANLCLQTSSHSFIFDFFSVFRLGNTKWKWSGLKECYITSHRGDSGTNHRPTIRKTHGMIPADQCPSFNSSILAFLW